VSGQFHSPAALPSGKEKGRRLGGPGASLDTVTASIETVLCSVKCLIVPLGALCPVFFI
jgi:hypothetical protein